MTLLERGERPRAPPAATTGLHSGARYAVNDPESAVECIAENRILRRIAPGSFEENGGLFVALTDEDMDYPPRFLTGCAACDIPTRELTVDEALALEPGQPGASKRPSGSGRHHGRHAAAAALLRQRGWAGPSCGPSPRSPAYWRPAGGSAES